MAGGIKDILSTRFLAAADAAFHCRCEVELLIKLAESGGGPAGKKAGGTWYFSLAALDMWLKRPCGPDTDHALDHLRPGYLGAWLVKPLGFNDDGCFYGRNCHLMGISGDSCIAIPFREHSKTAISRLFANNENLLRSLWPVRNTGGAVVGWDHKRAAETLIIGCKREGSIDPSRLGFTRDVLGHWTQRYD